MPLFSIVCSVVCYCYIFNIVVQRLVQYRTSNLKWEPMLLYGDGWMCHAANHTSYNLVLYSKIVLLNNLKISMANLSWTMKSDSFHWYLGIIWLSCQPRNYHTEVCKEKTAPGTKFQFAKPQLVTAQKWYYSINLAPPNFCTWVCCFLKLLFSHGAVCIIIKYYHQIYIHKSAKTLKQYKTYVKKFFLSIN